MSAVTLSVQVLNCKGIDTRPWLPLPTLDTLLGTFNSLVDGRSLLQEMQLTGLSCYLCLALVFCRIPGDSNVIAFWAYYGFFFWRLPCTTRKELH